LRTCSSTAGNISDCYSLRGFPRGGPPCLHPRLVQPPCLHPRLLQPPCLHPRLVQPSCLHPRLVQPPCLHPRLVQPSCLHPRLVQPSCLHPRLVQPLCLHHHLPCDFLCSSSRRLCSYLCSSSVLPCVLCIYPVKSSACSPCCSPFVFRFATPLCSFTQFSSSVVLFCHLLFMFVIINKSPSHLNKCCALSPPSTLHTAAAPDRDTFSITGR
uniref:Uncharacterized protein n=1 Tax=Maylandia zebra TaxID=106582 RepID=A0A3P9BK24_9CICH